MTPTSVPQRLCRTFARQCWPYADPEIHIVLNPLAGVMRETLKIVLAGSFMGVPFVENESMSPAFSSGGKVPP
jgi:hypothetical protein